jgi:sugar phosphate isomerase/epimerase
MNMQTALIVPIQDSTPFSPFSLASGLVENLKRANEAGYDGVELAITDPERLSPFEREQLLKTLNETGLAVCAITTGQAYGIEGISFTEEDPLQRRRAIERIKAHLSFVDELNLSAAVIIGLIRGKKGGEKALEFLIEALVECAGFGPTVKLALEPLNRYETGLVNNVEEAIRVLDSVGMENVGILFDTFHANIEEVSIEGSILKAGKRIFHVHVADSNRWAPGYGHLNFTKIIDALCKIDYDGSLSAEVLPKPNPNECLKKTICHLKGR